MEYKGHEQVCVRVFMFLRMCVRVRVRACVLHVRVWASWDHQPRAEVSSPWNTEATEGALSPPHSLICQN